MSDFHCNTPFNPIPPIGNKKNNLTSQSFGHLTVISLYGRTATQKVAWLCRCICGSWIVVPTSHLKSGHTTSCGCVHKIIGGRSPEYESYISAKSRCTNPKAQAYARYGGRGIKFLFASYREFITEIGQRPDPTYELDRINNNGHYEKGNVRWCTKQQNAINRRTTVFLTVDGITHHADRWAQQVGTQGQTIRWRIRHGWCATCSIFNPAHDICQHKI